MEILNLIKENPNITIALCTLIYTLMTSVLVYQSWQANRLNSKLLLLSQKPIIKIATKTSGDFLTLNLTNESKNDAFNISIRKTFSIKKIKIPSLCSTCSKNIDFCRRDTICHKKTISLIVVFRNELEMSYQLRHLVEIPVNLRRS